MSTSEEKSTQSLSLNQNEQNDGPPPAIFELEPKQQRFVNLYTTGHYTIQKMADLLDVHPNTVSKWLKRSDVQLAINEITVAVHDQVQTDLKMLTLKATRKLHELIDSPIDGVALQAVNTVLDRTGHKGKQEININKTVTTVEQKMRELVDSTILEGEYEDID